MSVLASYAPAIWLTARLALVTTLVLIVIGAPIAWWLARSEARGKELVAALVSLPLILPPTVIGFYLLIALGPNGPGGVLASLWGARTLAFSFEGLVIGSVIYSLPFMVGPLRLSFEGIGREVLETAATLGAGPVTSFFTIAAPLARNGLIAGAILSFAHTVGEFGVVLMIGGNIPGETRVLSTAIYDAVERLEWGDAHILSLSMVIFAFAVASLTMLIDRRASQIVR